MPTIRKLKCEQKLKQQLIKPKKTTMSKFFTSDKYPNCHLSFDQTGMKMIVTLNISVDVVPFLPQKNIFQGDKHLVFSMSKYVKNPTAEKMKEAYYDLLHKCQTIVRLAKVSVLNKQIIEINTR
jgi:hypothetical protein